MNAIFIYTVCALLTATLGQQLNDGGFFSEADSDYQDFQAPQSAQPQRSARPRSPAVPSASQPKVAPVAILKQINRHNEDGSYTYGFEGADGSFKIETKLATGEVIGKYGYVDDSGKVRTVEYGANKYGFQPSGEGITIPPVNIGNDTDTTEQPEDDTRQFIPAPVRPAKPQQPKRKPQRPVPQAPQQFFVPELQARPQIPQQPYFVREPEDFQVRQPQRPPTPTDINSLQLALGNELRDAPVFPFRPNEIPQTQQRFKTFQPEEDQSDEPLPPRPFPQTLTIPSAFDPAQSPQFVQPANDFSQQQFDFTSPKVANSFRGPQPQRAQRPKPRPQVLFLAPADDGSQPPNAVRRNSNVPQENRSILDELLKQYAVPNGSPAINDFSFSQNA